MKSAWFQRAFLLASGLVTMSEWAKASLVQDYGIPNTKIRVFPPGVDVRQWQCYSGKPSSRKRLRLLFVGGDFERKGGYVLIEAFRRGLSDFCELDIVTSAQALQTGDGVRVHTGLTPNSTLLKKYFAEADLFVMPTMGDATPFAVLEAMASGLPVITTRTGGLGEMVQDGVTGVFVAPSDPNGIIDAVTSLAGHRALLEQMGRAGRADVERRFSAESNGKGLIAYLREVSMSMPGGLRARS